MALLSAWLENEGTKLEQSREKICCRHCSVQVSELRYNGHRPVGKRMGADTDPLQLQAQSEREGLVDNQETPKQAVPRVRGLNWTEILGKSGLEAPGYHETIAKMKKEGRIKS